MTGIPPFPTSFLLLQQDGYLIRSCLATGLAELVHNKEALRGPIQLGLLVCLTSWSWKVATGVEHKWLKPVPTDKGIANPAARP